MWFLFIGGSFVWKLSLMRKCRTLGKSCRFLTPWCFVAGLLVAIFSIRYRKVGSFVKGWYSGCWIDATYCSPSDSTSSQRVPPPTRTTSPQWNPCNTHSHPRDCSSDYRQHPRSVNSLYKSTWVSTTTPHLAMALKKSLLDKNPLLYRSKNLNDL